MRILLVYVVPVLVPIVLSITWVIIVKKIYSHNEKNIQKSIDAEIKLMNEEIDLAENEELEEESTVICEYCASKVSVNAKKCTNCGAKINKNK